MRIKGIGLLGVLIMGSVSAMCGVPGPWTDVRVDGRTVSCWGRTYGYGTSVLPSKIVTQGEDILAGPVEIAAVVDGKEMKWSRASFRLLSSSAESARYVTSATSAKLSVECTFTTEFDGVTRAELSVTSKGRVKLSSLDVVLPLRRECAALFHHYPAGPVFEWDWPTKQMNSGAVPAAGMKLPFVFALWVGNDDRGIQIFSESDEPWSPADPKAAITLSPAGELRLNVLSSCELSSKWSWTWGFVATPVKPYWMGHYRTHYSQDGGYGAEKRPGEGQPCGLDHLENAGANYVGCHEQWSDEQSLPRPKNPDDLRSLIKGCHDRGMGLVLYTGTWMSTRSPEFNKRWRSTPIDQHFVYERADNHDRCYYMCTNSDFRDLQLRLYDEAFKEYGFDGLYLDGPAATLPCNNAEHGCGYVGKDGKLHCTMPIWKPRETMKRFHKLVKGQPRPCIIVGHSSASITLPILSFVDVYLDGEHLLAWKKLGTDQYPEEIVRAEMSGHNFGIPAVQLPVSGTEAERERGRTVCLLYDGIVEWSYGYSTDIWRAWDRFGVSGSKWVGYWRTDDLVEVWGEGIKVSAYLHKGRGALFVVANLGTQAAIVKLRVKRTGLGIARQVALGARDECSGENVAMEGESVSVEVMAGSFRMVSVTAR